MMRPARDTAAWFHSAALTLMITDFANFPAGGDPYHISFRSVLQTWQMLLHGNPDVIFEQIVDSEAAILPFYRRHKWLRDVSGVCESLRMLYDQMWLYVNVTEVEMQNTDVPSSNIPVHIHIKFWNSWELELIRPCCKLLNQWKALQSSVVHTDVSGLYPGFVSFVVGKVKSHNNTQSQGDLT